ncbi:MAG: Zn-binding domain-containing protein, partial [Chloroflexota bacterium]
AIERGLREGSVRAVAATNALELGIDIGGMDAALLVGYPGTIASAWQQSGRAGRGMDPALALLVATADPLDQFLAAHPQYFFERSPEHALMDPDNLLVLLGHLRCAAFELPFSAGERYGQLDPQRLEEFLDFLEQDGALHHSGPKYFWIADAYPAQALSLRSASAETIALQVGRFDDPPAASEAQTIGTIDYASALWMVHPQAIYLHEAQQYLVEALDLEERIARLRPSDADYYTQPRRQTQVALVEQHAQASERGALHAHGELQVTTQVVGYQKVRWHTHEVLAVEPLALPATELLTTGYWLALDEASVEALRQEGLWRGDPNDYGPAWPEIRRRARQRDEFRCQVCGAPEAGREHDVHHKVPFRLFAASAQANQLDNLVTLCHDCHMRAEAAVRVRSGLSGLAYALGHLAPFFLMCDVEDLGVHHDPQAAFAGGRPAVAIYDHAPGGIGLSTRLFELHAGLLQRALELVRACPCTDGCPSCTGPGGQGLGAPTQEAAFGGKAETLAILERLVQPGGAGDRLDS